MGVIHHAVYLTYFEAARVEYVRRRGPGYAGWTERGVHLAVAESHVRHKRPLRFDENVTVEATLVELGRASMTFAYRMTRPEAPTDIVAEGDTLLATVGNDGAIRLMPEDLARLLCGPERFPVGGGQVQ
jgi:acyl-CoA thioester hydrolase